MQLLLINKQDAEAARARCQRKICFNLLSSNGVYLSPGNISQHRRHMPYYVARGEEVWRLRATKRSSRQQNVEDLFLVNCDKRTRWSWFDEKTWCWCPGNEVVSEEVIDRSTGSEEVWRSLVPAHLPSPAAANLVDNKDIEEGKNRKESKTLFLSGRSEGTEATTICCKQKLCRMLQAEIAEGTILRADDERWEYYWLLMCAYLDRVFIILIEHKMVKHEVMSEVSSGKIEIVYWLHLWYIYIT